MNNPIKFIFTIIALAIFAAQFVAAGTTSTATTTPNPPSFNISSTSLPLCRGQTNIVPITVSNFGYTPAVAYGEGASNSSGPQMQQVQVSINSKGLFSQPSSDLLNINPKSSNTINLPVFVNANASSLVFAPVNLNYNFLYFYADSETRNLTFVTQSCPNPLSMQIYPQILTSGTIQNITINLTNTGNFPLNSISLHFTIPGADGAWLSLQPAQIPTLAPHSTVILNKNVYIAGNESDQSVPLNVTVLYYNGTSLYQIYQNQEILASGLVSLSPSSFTISPSNPTPASIFSISFILTDTGTAGASALTATPIAPSGFTTFGSNSVFVGSITADSQTPVTLSLLTSNAVKPGSYTIPIRLNYLNNLRQNLSIWANTTVTISPASLNATQSARFRTSQSSAGGGLTLMLFIIVVVLGFLYYRERNRAGRPIIKGIKQFYNEKIKHGADKKG